MGIPRQTCAGLPRASEVQSGCQCLSKEIDYFRFDTAPSLVSCNDDTRGCISHRLTYELLSEPLSVLHSMPRFVRDHACSTMVTSQGSIFSINCYSKGSCVLWFGFRFPHSRWSPMWSSIESVWTLVFRNCCVRQASTMLYGRRHFGQQLSVFGQRLSVSLVHTLKLGGFVSCLRKAPLCMGTNFRQLPRTNPRRTNSRWATAIGVSSPLV